MPHSLKSIVVGSLSIVTACCLALSTATTAWAEEHEDEQFSVTPVSRGNTATINAGSKGSSARPADPDTTAPAPAPTHAAQGGAGLPTAAAAVVEPVAVEDASGSYVHQVLEQDGRLLAMPGVAKAPTSPAPEPSAPSAPAGPSRGDVEAVARSAVASLQVPYLMPQLGPDPSVNEWKMLVVGFPIWLWVENPAPWGTSVSQSGIDITLDAQFVGVVFDMGDGERPVSCDVMYRYNSYVEPGAPSPTCGYVYKHVGQYTVTATSAWIVNWTAAGYSGQLWLETSNSRPLKIGELRAVVTG